MTMTRRDFLRQCGLAYAAINLLPITRTSRCANNPKLSSDKPNFVLVMTDDQGFGDLGCHGNSDIRTPNLDRFASESLEMSRFYVNPLCSPTRASLMTGRYHLRTGVQHTSRGAAKMFGDEVTIAEPLSQGGYRTGIFGKWHLGDNYPMRPQDQGFQEVLIHRSGGISQPPDGECTYFEPILWHNGKRLVKKKYCTDIFFDAAIKFIKTNQDKPFFVYLPTNVPHGPLQVDEKYSQPFIDAGFQEKTAKVYGMLKNFDENFGRLLETLDRLRLQGRTIVIFMTDNGPDRGRYNAGLRGGKGTVYEGGIRVPFFVRWPQRISGGQKIDRIAAHIDILPTLLAAAGQSVPKDLTIDGINLLPLWTGQVTPDQWTDRTLFVQHIKAMVQEPYKNAAVWNQRYKLVLYPGTAFDTQFKPDPENLKLELYDIENDSAEEHDIASSKPHIVQQFRSQYERWFEEMRKTRNFQPGLIHIDPLVENPTLLCRYHDATHFYHDSTPSGWPVRLVKTGRYRISIIKSVNRPFSLDRLWKTYSSADLVVEWHNSKTRVLLSPKQNATEVHLTEGEGILDAYFEVKHNGKIQQIRKGEVVVEYLMPN